MIDIIGATTLSATQFRSNSPLGLSLKRLAGDSRIKQSIAFSNRRGLPEIYNAAISTSPAEILVFMHDDVWIEDIFFVDLLISGLQNFDLIGVAGTRRRQPNQLAWAFSAFVDNAFVKEEPEQLSGAIGHGNWPFGEINSYGPIPQECELLDGLFFAVKKSTLQESGIRFDQRFDFHFYDLDFCRQARQCGLRVGTWPISLTHQSGGNYGSAQWWSSYRTYIEKWGD